MKRITHSLPILALAIVIALGAGMVAALSARPRVEPQALGSERYTPTKLEWLALPLQAHYGINFLETQGVRINFIPEAPDTILVLLQHTPSASREVMNIHMDTPEG
jgi:hypothetical protein